MPDNETLNAVLTTAGGHHRIVCWEPGDVIVERQVWHGAVQFATVSVVIEAAHDRLVHFIPTGAPFWFPEHPVFPSPDGRHPWHGRTGWDGHGKLTITRPWTDHSLGHFWHGDDRSFSCWYVNIEEPVRVTEIGLDGQDLELDIVVLPDRTWHIKDDELLDTRVEQGRWTADEVEAIRRSGHRIITDVLEPDEWWWDERWATWKPPTDLAPPVFPAGWRDVPVPKATGPSE